MTQDEAQALVGAALAAIEGEEGISRPYDAAIADAVEFLVGMPEGIPVPMVGLDADGEFYFKWQFPRRLMTAYLLPFGRVQACWKARRLNGRGVFDRDQRGQMWQDFVRPYIDAARAAGEQT